MTRPDVAAVAREAVNTLDWNKVYAAARRRTLTDMTGAFYDEHLAREIADRVAAYFRHHLTEGASDGE